MPSTILVPMDDSALAERALEYALETHPDADVAVLHVVGGPSPMMGKAVQIALEDDMQQTADEHADAVLERARAIAADYDTEIETDVGVGHPGKVIVARSEAYDTVVIGSHGGSLADRLFVGDVAETVFRRSPVPVTVVR